MYYQFIQNAVSIQKIEELMKWAQTAPFEKATVQFYEEKRALENIRNNFRLEFVDEFLVNDIHKAILLSTDFPFSLDNESYVAPSSHFRSYRYEKGQYFKP